MDVLKINDDDDDDCHRNQISSLSILLFSDDQSKLHKFRFNLVKFLENVSRN